MLLQRPTYYSNYGAAGVTFSRDLAMDFFERGMIARLVGFPWAIEYETGVIGYHDRVRPTVAGLHEACSSAASPTHMLLRREAVGVEGEIWVSPVPVPEFSIEGGFPNLLNPAVLVDAFVLYDCSVIAG
jgi:hypothetical protein